jgi:hypothetical protein
MELAERHLNRTSAAVTALRVAVRLLRRYAARSILARPPRLTLRRGGRVVECTALEMRHACKGIVGSNPTLSARASFV